MNFSRREFTIGLLAATSGCVSQGSTNQRTTQTTQQTTADPCPSGSSQVENRVSKRAVNRYENAHDRLMSAYNHLGVDASRDGLLVREYDEFVRHTEPKYELSKHGRGLDTKAGGVLSDITYSQFYDALEGIESCRTALDEAETHFKGTREYVGSCDVDNPGVFSDPITDGLETIGTLHESLDGFEVACKAYLDADASYAAGISEASQAATRGLLALYESTTTLPLSPRSVSDRVLTYNPK